MGSPTQRSLAAWRKDGAVAEVVERWNQHARVRHDLFGVIDIVALKDGHIIGVQTTSDGNLSARVAKAKAEPKLLAWFRCGGRFVVEGWGKKGQRGKRKLWSRRQVEITEEQIERNAAEAAEEE